MERRDIAAILLVVVVAAVAFTASFVLYQIANGPATNAI